MLVEKEQIQKLLNMTDEELLPRLSAALNVLGVPSEAHGELLGDLDLLRKRAKEVSDFDIYKARLLLGEDGMQNLLSVLGGEHGISR